MPAPLPLVLSIAGSDSGAAAGLQADVKAAQALGAHCLTVVTAITAQNTHEIRRVQVLSPALVEAQLAALAADLPLATVKLGMLGSPGVVRAVARFLARLAPRHVVVDPVLWSTGGRALLGGDAVAAYRRHLLPLATLLTPNLPEAAALTGRALDRVQDLDAAAADLRAAGAAAVLLKGGHGDGARVVDRLYTARGITRYSHRRRKHGARGTGCTLATAIAAGLARGLALDDAVGAGVAYVQAALARSWPAGRGGRRLLGHPRPA